MSAPQAKQASEQRQPSKTQAGIGESVDHRALPLTQAGDMTRNTVVHKGDIPYKLMNDTEFALRFFLGRKMDRGVGSFQRDVFPVLLHNQDQTALAIPRDYTKTTMAQIALALRLVFTEASYGVYVRDTMTSAALSVASVVALYKSDNWVAAFGAPVFLTARAGDGVYRIFFPHSGKTVIYQAISYKSSLSRGNLVDQLRPDIAVIDDLDQREDSPDTRKAKRLWFWATFKKAMKRDSPLLYLANLVAPDVILQELLDHPSWDSYHYGCIKENGEALWPEYMPIDRIALEYEDAARASMLYVWFQEMMNVPLPAGAVLQEEDIKRVLYLEPASQPALGFLIVDLAISSNDTADEAAIAVVLWQPHDENKLAEMSAIGAEWAYEDLHADEGVWVVRDTFNKQGQTIFELYDSIELYAKRWGVQCVFIEQVAYQEAALQFYPYLAVQRGWPEAEFFPVKPANRRKNHRINTWLTLVKDGLFCLVAGEFKLTQMMLKFSKESKDMKRDLLDACSYSADVVREKLGVVIDCANKVNGSHQAQWQQCQSTHQLMKRRG